MNPSNIVLVLTDNRLINDRFMQFYNRRLPKQRTGSVPAAISIKSSTPPTYYLLLLLIRSSKFIIYEEESLLLNINLN